MSKSLQWVIGLGVVLIVAAVIVSSAAAFFLPRLAASGTAPIIRLAPRLPFLPGLIGPGGLAVRRPFMGFFGLASCLWPVLLAGLIILAVSLFSRRPAEPTFAPSAPLQPAAPAAAPGRVACTNCGQPLQPGWRHCPNCGTPVSGPAAGGVG